MRRWGLDYESLREIKPDLIMLSTSLMGQTGPYAGYAGYGNSGAALSGFQNLVGWPEQICAENPREYYNNKDTDLPVADKPDF